MDNVCGNCIYYDKDKFCYMKDLYSFTDKTHVCDEKNMDGELYYKDKSPRVTILPRNDFEQYFKTYKLGENERIISIIDVDSDSKHIFEDSEKVINLEFNDVSESEENCLTEKQAKELYSFIDNNIGCDFIIHCEAGRSRSQAIGQYLLDMYGDVYCVNEVTAYNKPLTPNIHVLATLKREFYKDKGLFYFNNG